jgi:hypothetical protein
MFYFSENLKNWLLGKDEIDYDCMAVPPVEESPQELLEKFKKSNDRSEISKINKKLNKLGYEIKTVHILNKKN